MLSIWGNDISTTSTIIHCGLMDWKVLQCHRGTLLHCLVERQFSSKFGLLLSHRSENSVQQAKKKKRKYQNFYIFATWASTIIDIIILLVSIHLLVHLK